MGEPRQIEPQDEDSRAFAKRLARDVQDLILERMEENRPRALSLARDVQALILLRFDVRPEDRAVLEEAFAAAGVAGPPDDAAARLAMLRALPVEREPPTAEELTMFEQLEADVRVGRSRSDREQAPPTALRGVMQASPAGFGLCPPLPLELAA